MKKCRKCNEPLPADDPCPLCGEMPGVSETITDLPKTDFKAARKKLREEIREGLEEDRKRL